MEKRDDFKYPLVSWKDTFPMQLKLNNLSAKIARKSHCWNQCFNFILQSSTSRRLGSVLLKSSFGIKIYSYINYLRVIGSDSILDLQELGLQHLLFSSRFLGNGNMCVRARRELLQTSVCFLRLNHQETTIVEQSRQYQEGLGSCNSEYFSIMVLTALPQS